MSILGLRNKACGLVSSDGGLWTPAISSADHWYQASDSSTITTSGSKVTQWDDKIGSNNLTQGTGANRPDYDTDHVEFRGDFGNSASNFEELLFTSDINPRTVGMVLRLENYDAQSILTGCICMLIGAPSADNDYIFAVANSVNHAATYALSFDGGNAQEGRFYFLTDSDYPGDAEENYQDTGGSGDYVDGFPTETKLGIIWETDGTAGAVYDSVGSATTGSSATFAGNFDLYEMIVYSSTISDAERNNLANYLIREHGVGS